MMRGLAKASLIALGLLIVEPAIIRPFEALLTFVFIVVVWESDLKFPRGRALTLLALVPVLLLLRIAIPDLRIEERDSPFVLQDPTRNPFAETLPMHVYDTLAAEFFAAYPPSKTCAAPDVGCFLQQPETARPYGFSADGMWDHPRYSRVVDDIDFSSLEDLRMAEANDLLYNFYRKTPGNVSRAELPYFVGYTVPHALIGSRLCWRGSLLWPEGSGYVEFDNLDEGCRTFAAGDVGREIFGYRIRPDATLAMHLDRPFSAIGADFLKHATVPALALTFLALAVLRLPPARRFLPYTVAAGATLLTAWVLDHFLGSGLVGHLTLFRDGNDGMVHDTYGHDILRGLVAGQGWRSLVAGEPTFYFMPGLRYFVALEKLIFGDTHWLTLMALAIQPLVVYRLTRVLLPREWATALAIFYLFIPLFEHLGFAHFIYVKQAADGNAEGVGHFFLFAAMFLTLRVIDERACPPRRALAVGFLWFCAVAMRPNFAIAAAILPLFAFLPILFAGAFRAPLAAALGISPIILIPLHNFIFGHDHVLVTASALIPQNLPMTPAHYLAAVGQISSGDWHGDALRAAIAQLRGWNNYSDIYRLIPFAALLHICVRHGVGRPLRALAWAGLGQQLLLFFYLPGGRYSYAAWFIAFIVFVAALREFYLPALLARFPQLAQAVPGRLGPLLRQMDFLEPACAPAAEKRPQ